MIGDRLGYLEKWFSMDIFTEVVNLCIGAHHLEPHLLKQSLRCSFTSKSFCLNVLEFFQELFLIHATGIHFDLLNCTLRAVPSDLLLSEDAINILSGCMVVIHQV